MPEDIFKRYRYEFVLLGVIVAIAIIAVIFADKFGIFSDRERLEQYVGQFGILGPLVVIGASIVEVVIAPIPGGITPTAAGVLYGKLIGTGYVLCGSIIGANMTFWIARRWGEKFFLQFIAKKEIDRFRNMVTNRQKFLWIAYFIPVLPYDVINIAMGLSREISWKKFLIFNTLGMAVSMSFFTIFGSALANLIF